MRGNWNKLGRVAAGAAFVAALAGAAPLPAIASDYCVNEAACVAAGGTDEGTTGAALQTALEAAEKHANSGGPDRVLVGTGTYTRSEGFSYGGDPVLVRGAGAGATSLTRPAAAGPSVLSITAAGVTVQDLTVVIPAHAGLIGARMTAGTMEGDAIESASAAIPVFGLEIKGGVFAHGTLHAAGGIAVESRGGEVLYSTIFGGEIGAEAVEASTLRGDRISGATPVFSYANPLVLEDSLIDLGGTAGHGVEIVGNINGKALSFLRHDAIVHGPGGTGVFVHAEKENATALLENSIVAEVGTPLFVLAEGAGTTGSLSADYSSFDVASSKATPTGGATATLGSEHVLSTLPSFVSPLTGDYRLAPGSPLIDAGTPGALGLGELATDLAGNPRIVHGRRDAGPYEYQWRPPSVIGTSDRTTVEIGKPVTFTGTGLASEPGDGIASYQWTFDDGASVGAGSTAVHAFSQPGAHTATLTATDLEGLAATSTVAVTATKVDVCRETAGKSAGCIERTVRNLQITPRAFHPAAHGAAVALLGGGKVSYEVGGGVSLVNFTLARLAPGVAKGAACVRRRRHVHGRACTRIVKVTSFSRISRQGGNGFRLTGRSGGHRLAPGSYRLTAVPASGTAGSGASAVFRILR